MDPTDPANKLVLYVVMGTIGAHAAPAFNEEHGDGFWLLPLYTDEHTENCPTQLPFSESVLRTSQVSSTAQLGILPYGYTRWVAA